MNISSISPMYSNLRQNNVARLNRMTKNNVSLKSISNDTFSKSVSFTGDGDGSPATGKKGLFANMSDMARGMLLGSVLTATVLTGGAGAALGTGVVSVKDKNPDILRAPWQADMNLSEMADVTNGIVTVDGSTLELQYKYNYLDDVIREATFEVYDTKPDDTDELRTEYKYLRDLKEKREFQDFVSQTYTRDGKFYITLYPFENQQQLKMSIENFKRLFDIKDGALSKYPENGVNNDNWTTGEVTNDGEKNFSAGQVIVVDLDDIDTKNISFQY